MEKERIEQELEEMFGEEEVRVARAQEFLARRFTQQKPYIIRDAITKFMRLRGFDKQKQYVRGFDKDLRRAFICSFLCNTASQVVMDLATTAIEDIRDGRAVLGGKIVNGNVLSGESSEDYDDPFDMTSKPKPTARMHTNVLEKKGRR